MIERRQLLEAMKQKRGVLATIINRLGSSYRRIGTSMLFLEDGNQIGILSGGCLEHQIADDARKVRDREMPFMRTYDLEEEDLLGLGESSGCPGVITVLLEPVTQALIEDWVQLDSYLARGISVTLFKNLITYESNYLTDTGETFGSNVTGPKQHPSSPCFHYTYQADPRLVLFGAGEDAIPLSFLAEQAGFHVMVSDWREALYKPERFASSVDWVIGFPKKIEEELDIGRRDDYVVVMTHHLMRDREILLGLKDKPVKYLGILGSKKRLNRVLSREFLDLFPSDVFHAPIGLPISAEGPYEIAISIMAELIACRRKEMK